LPQSSGCGEDSQENHGFSQKEIAHVAKAENVISILPRSEDRGNWRPWQLKTVAI